MSEEKGLSLYSKKLEKWEEVESVLQSHFKTSISNALDFDRDDLSDRDLEGIANVRAEQSAFCAVQMLQNMISISDSTVEDELDEEGAE